MKKKQTSNNDPSSDSVCEESPQPDPATQDKHPIKQKTATAEQQPGATDPADEIEIIDKQAWQEASQAVEELRLTKEKLARAAADFDNFRKRLQREKEDAVRYANEALLSELLPVIDNFELGLQAAQQSQDTKGILMGMEMVRSQLSRFLSDNGVQEICGENIPFDPNFHEAVARETSSEKPDSTVIAMRRKGYKLRERLLRPASVVVSVTPEEHASEQ